MDYTPARQRRNRRQAQQNRAARPAAGPVTTTKADGTQTTTPPIDHNVDRPGRTWKHPPKKNRRNKRR